MELHKLLQRQIRKFLPADVLDHDDCSAFLHAVSESYKAYERDQELSNHAFSISEAEYHKVNQALNREVEARNLSIAKLMEIVHANTPDYVSPSGDDLVALAEFVKNISERQTQLEQESNKNIKRITSLISSLNSGVLFENESRKILFTNEIFCQMFGIPLAPDQLTGFDCSDSAEQSKAMFTDPEGFIQRIDELLAIKKKAVGDILYLKDGRVFERDFVPVFMDDQYKGHLWNYTDITQKRLAEQELEQALQNAQQASRAKESFLANMSHEIRTPLNAIIGMMRELGREQLTPKQNAYLSHSETSAKHLLSIVNNILDMSRIEAGELILEYKEFSLSSIMNMVHSILFVKAREKGLMLKFHSSPDIQPALIGDGGRIRQILINLIGNSIKFTEKGQVEVDVNVINETSTHQKIHFSVCDSGIGMSPEYLKMVFEKFSQEHSHSTKKYEGTGLGMTITKEMINLMGGNLNIQSEKGQGTNISFTLNFPIGDPAKVIAKQEIIIDKSLAGLRCLLVEDNEMNRLIATQSLVHFGCQVVSASDGQKALEALQNGGFDFVLMDIQMPVMDGMETTQYIRNTMQSDIPIIALTANAFRSEINRYLAIGMNDYITKPYEEYHLFSTIANTLNVKMLDKNGADADAETEQPIAPLYNLSKMADLSRGDQSFVQKMVDIFIEHTPITVHEMNAAFLEKDYLKISKLAHRLKPSIANMGIQKLVHVLRDLEIEAKSDSVDHLKVQHMVQTTDAVIQQVVEQLKHQFDKKI